MKNYEYAENDIAYLQLTLKEHNSLYCKCGRKIDFFDIEWNNIGTDAGTPCCYIEIKCQACDTEIKRIESWYPGIDDIDDLLSVMERDW